jgi:hypothetical protein
MSSWNLKELDKKKGRLTSGILGSSRSGEDKDPKEVRRES